MCYKFGTEEVEKDGILNEEVVGIYWCFMVGDGFEFFFIGCRCLLILVVYYNYLGFGFNFGNFVLVSVGWSLK